MGEAQQFEDRAKGGLWRFLGNVVAHASQHFAPIKPAD